MKTCTGMLLVVLTVLGSSFVHCQSHSVRALEYTLWGEILPSDHRLRLTTDVLLFNSGKLKADTIKMSLRFDTIESIQDSRGMALPYEASKTSYDQPEGNVHIFRVLASQETAMVRIRYGGVYYGDVAMRIASKNSWLFTESMYCPLPISYGGDPNWVKSDMYITVPDSQTAVGPGKLIDVQSSPGKKTFHWKLKSPPTTALSIISAKYVAKEFTYSGIPITTYLYPEDQEQADSVVVALGSVVAFYQEQFGKYPFDELKIIETDRRGGYGPPGMLIVNQYSIQSASKGSAAEFRGDFLLAHELAHHWWGGRVGQRFSAPGEQFMTEALAQYSAFKYAERVHATKERIFEYKFINAPKFGLYLGNHFSLFENDHRRNQLPVEYRPISEIKLGDADYYWAAYYKGAHFFRALSAYLGDSVLTAGLRAYADRFEFKTGTLEELRKSVEAASGNDLKWFFDDWVSTTKRVEFELSNVECKKDGENRYRTKIIVSNNGDLRMPVKVVAQMIGGREIPVEFPATILDKQSQEIVTDNEVSSAVLDPDWVTFDADRTNNIYPPRGSLTFLIAPPDVYSRDICYGPVMTWGLTDRLRVGAWLTNVNTVASLRRVQFPFEWRVAGYYGLKSERAGYSILLNSWIGMPSNQWTYGTLSENVKGTQTHDLHGTYRWKESSSLKTSFERTRIYDVTYYDEKDFEAGTSSTFSMEFENDLRDWYIWSKLRVGARSLNSLYQFTRLSLDLRTTPSFLNGLQFRLFAGIVRGAFPSQEALYLSGDVRSSSVAYWFLDPDRKISTQEHLHTSGDANLVGYFGTHQRGNNAVSLSAEYPILPAYRLKAFVGGGSTWNEGSPRVLWNAGLAVDLGGIRVDFPVYISRPMHGEHTFGLRWLIEIKF